MFHSYGFQTYCNPVLGDIQILLVHLRIPFLFLSPVVSKTYLYFQIFTVGMKLLSWKIVNKKPVSEIFFLFVPNIPYLASFSINGGFEKVLTFEIYLNKLIENRTCEISTIWLDG